MTWKLPPPDSKACEVWIESNDDTTNDYKFFLLSGAVRSSKTVASLLAYADRVASGPKDAPRLMVGNTERSLKRNCLDPLQEFIGKKHCKINVGTGEMILFGRKIYLAGASNIAALAKFQGPTVLDLYCDEIATYPEEIVNMVMSRLSLPDSKGWGTCNPGPPAHYLKKNYR